MKAPEPTLMDDVVKAYDEVTKAIGRPPNTLVTSIENVERLNPELAEKLRAAGPDVPVPLVLDSPVEDEPVRVINVKGVRAPATTEITSIVESLRPKDLWFWVDQVALDTSMQISREDMPRLPPNITFKTAMFHFTEHPALEAGRMYLFWFMEAGRSRIFQKIRVEKNAKLGWIKTVSARPGAKSCFVWVEIREESGKLVSRSSRLLFGREDKTWKGM